MLEIGRSHVRSILSFLFMFYYLWIRVQGNLQRIKHEKIQNTMALYDSALEDEKPIFGQLYQQSILKKK